jgi:glycosyltransferase involved in cell wall biosynthesis
MKKAPKISIVIPTLNEELLLPNLLDSISNQSFTDYEVIVADAGSTDRTKEIALEFGAQVVKGGMPGPGRNRGGEVAKGEMLYFLDADVTLDQDSLLSSYAEIRERELNAATCRMDPDSDSIRDNIFYEVSNILIMLSSLASKGYSFGTCIIVERRIFTAVGGFDEDRTMGEDVHFIKKVSKNWKFGYLYRTHVTTNPRRLRKEGHLGLTWKYILGGLYESAGGVKEGDIEYDFGNYLEEEILSKKKNNSALLKALREFRKSIQKVASQQSTNPSSKKLSKWVEEFLVRLGRHPE